MKKLVPAACLAAVLGVSAFAQDADEAEVQSLQTAAQDAFAAGNAAFVAQDWESARRAFQAALATKPGHPAVLRALTIIGERSGQAEDAFTALELMARAGLTYDAGRHELLRGADPARYDAVAAALAANAEPVGEAEIIARVDAPNALIEGIAVDIETDRIFLSSVAERRILMLEPFSRDTFEVFADAGDGLWSVFGLKVDDRNRLLWAASGSVPQTPLEEGESEGTALFAFDLVTGEPYRRYEIDGAVQMADFVTRDGMIFISDSQAPRIYRLDEHTGDLEVLVEDDRFVNLQGLALTRGALYAADYAMGIWRIDFGDGSASLVRPGDDSLIGIDGFLNTRDGRLVAVRNGAPPHQVMAIDLTEDGRAVASTEVLLRGHEAMMEGTEPTLIDLADGRGWLVANSAWPLFPEDGSIPEQERPQTLILEMDIE